ncbi:RNI-like protein [Microstroma glucosiphilum]|uniref:RNI-like protein n=1 Tax=Pseudomicrostroma glucosiphilum TaxID=1684307 RepID=A0A316U4Y9_9BASI|nr:RNI-like protein [Pseudomicrostroma glucosiphilum]PWN19888.1 RNI-like protein [Pseudomicrostroma glucosiphilum]
MGGQSVQAKEDDIRKGSASATSPVKDPAVRQASQEVRSAAIHSNVSQVEDDNFCIGSRMAQVQTHPPSVRYGTVRYRGRVAKKEGSWLGIEWDDPLRGKHDGQHEGTRYFTCSRPGRVASFIRPPSGLSATLFIGGVAFLEALEARYTHRTEEQVASGDDAVPSRHTRKTVADIDIEVPNLDKVINKVTQLTSLKTVSLTGPPEHKGPENAHAVLPVSSRIEALKTLIGRVGTGPSLSLNARLIGGTIPNVNHLDLSQSLVSSWTSIASITRHLAHLRTLRLDFNRLPAPGSEEDPGRDMVDTLAHSEGFQRLKELSLNGTRIDWPHVCRLARHLPSLEVLELNRNCLAGIESTVATQAPSPPIFGSLQELDLSNNEIADWQSVAMALCELPELAKLNLANNKLAVIPAPDCTRREERFRRLASINLSGNPLLNLRGPDDLLIELDVVWTSIYALDLWFTHGERDDPGVRVLKASPAQSNEEAELAQSDNPEQLSPIQQELQKWSMNLIARLPHLMTLNGTDISPRQRRDAEDQWLSTLERRLESAERNVKTPHGEALDILTRSLENREPRWRPLRAARGLPTLVDALQASEQPIANTIKANLINLTLRISSVAPSAPLVTSPSERTVTAFSVLPSQTLKAVRPRVLKALKIKPSVLNRAKANRDPDGEGQVRWYGVIRNGSGTNPVVFELDDDMRELAWWGFTGTRETGPDAATGSSQLADEIWLCLPEAGFNL